MKKTYWALAPAACLTLCALTYAQATWKLNVNGSAVGTNAKVIGGVTYVPINDVAKALKMKATISGKTITLKPAGGTFQIANKLQGVQGEELFSGKWGFTVTGVQRADVYKAKYLNNLNRDDTYDGMGSDVVAVSCRLKNGTKVKQEFAFSARDYGMNTSLTDMDAGTYQPAGYDVLADEPAPLGKFALPGSSIPFNIVFRVTKGTKLKDLVFSVVLYNERGDNKSTDFRVALKE